MVLGILDWNTFVFPHAARLPVGAVLAGAGLSLAFWGVRSLSLHTSLGLKGPLVESGAYRYSRNPQYVGDVLFLVGWGLLCNSLLTWVA